MKAGGVAEGMVGRGRTIVVATVATTPLPLLTLLANVH